MKRLPVSASLMVLLLFEIEPLYPFSLEDKDAAASNGISVFVSDEKCPDHRVSTDPSCLTCQPDTMVITLFAGDRISQTLWLRNNGPETYQFYASLNCGLVSDSTNNAIRLDGLDDHLCVGRTCALDIPNEITLEAWINLQEGAPGISPIISKGLEGFGYELYVEDSGTGRRLVFRIDPGCIQSNSTLEENEWYHVAATYDSDSIRLYINGIQDAVKCANGSLTIVNRELSIGTNSLGLANRSFFHGMMDEIRIWNHARTEMEIFSFMHRQLSGVEPGLAGYWSFNETPFMVLIDQTGNSKGYLADGATRIISRAPVMNLVQLPDSIQTVPTGSMSEIGIQYSTAHLQSGYYHFNIDIISLPENLTDFSLPVRIHILNAPSMAIHTNEISFGEREIYTLHRSNLEVINEGTKILIIDSVATSLLGSRITPASGVIEPGMKKNFLIELFLREAKPFQGCLTFYTNDPSDGRMRVPVTGRGINTETVKVHKPIADTLQAGEECVKGLTLTNCSSTEEIMINGSVSSFKLPEQNNDRILKPDSCSWVSITLPRGSMTLCPGGSIQFKIEIDAINMVAGDYYAEMTIDCYAPLYYTKGIKPILLHILPEETVNVENATDNPVQIYPNPTSGKFTVQARCQGPWSVAITTINGQVIFKAQAEGESIQLDLSDFQKGVYLVTVITNHGFQTLRIIKL